MYFQRKDNEQKNRILNEIWEDIVGAFKEK